MAFKFPFTNYHELNLTWVLDQLKKLFEESAENVSVIQNYDGRLTAVETELPTVSETASEASRAAAAAATLAQTAKATADTAQENAIQAQRAAGTAQNTAERAQEAADAATQAAQQAQATAQNFDGRITQAENDASSALEASRSFENRVQSAITTANNAARTATDAQGIATRADQNAGAALDKIGDLSALDTTAKQNLVMAINEALENGGKVDSVNGQTGAVVLNAGDIGYNDSTVETALDGKQNAPTAAGSAGQVLGLDANLAPMWITPAAAGGGGLTPAQELTALTYIQNGEAPYYGRLLKVVNGKIIVTRTGSPTNFRGVWVGTYLAPGTGVANNPAIPEKNILLPISLLENINNIEVFTNKNNTTGIQVRLYYFNEDSENVLTYISNTILFTDNSPKYDNIPLTIPANASFFCLRVYYASDMNEDATFNFIIMFNNRVSTNEVKALILENNG